MLVLSPAMIGQCSCRACPSHLLMHDSLEELIQCWMDMYSMCILRSKGSGHACNLQQQCESASGASNMHERKCMCCGAGLTSFSRSSVGMKVWLSSNGGRLSLPPHLNHGYTSSQFLSLTMRPAEQSFATNAQVRRCLISCLRAGIARLCHQPGVYFGECEFGA